MEEQTEESGIIEYLQTNSDEIVEQVSQYGYLVGDALFYILAGMLSVFVVHKLATKFLYPHVDNKRFLLVTFGTLYVLVLVITGIMVLKQVGFDVSTGGRAAIMAVLLLAVVLYLILPFLPRLPFMPGHMIEAQGVMGSMLKVSYAATEWAARQE